MRVLFAVVALSMLCGAFAGVVSVENTGVANQDMGVILDSPPASVADDAPAIETDDGNLIAFNEREGVILADGVDIKFATSWGSSLASLPTGIPISSTMILLNSPGSARQDAIATFNFAGKVLGVAGDKAGNLEAASNAFFGSPTTAYPGAFNARGTGEGSDHWEIVGENSLKVQMAVTEPGDWIRVFSLHVEEEDLTTEDCHTVELPYEPHPANAAGVTFNVPAQESTTDCVTLSFVCDEDLLVCEDQLVYTYEKVNPSGQRSPAYGGKLTYFQSVWNSVTGEFQLDVATGLGDSGSVSNSFWLVISNKDNPKGDADQLVIMYADWAAAKVALYVYNGQNSDNSWETKHFFGSVPLGKVQDGDTRSWSITVDGLLAEQIRDYDAGLGGAAEWDGFAFGNLSSDPNKIGTWMHMSSSAISFNDDGSVSDYNPSGSTQTWWDKSNLSGVTSDVECL